MLESLRNRWETQPLNVILFAALLFRLVSAIFSKGYGMHDDHFLVIEAAQSWIDGFDYNHWLPENRPDGIPTGHSFFYVGLHYLFFRLLELLGVFDPQLKMLFVRVIHALLSLLTVKYGYKITERLWGIENAKVVGLLLGLLWFYPVLSVRNMVEMVCVPFALLAYWQLIDKKGMKRFVIAGLFIGISMGVRVQMYLIFGGLGLALLIRKEIIEAFVFGLSAIFALFITQLTDLMLWGKPFAEMIQYVLYNSTHYDDYIAQSWFQYFIVITGLLIPPISLFLWFGFFKNWKKNLLFFLPVVIFFLFHSFYPNKQERFILPILPFFIILGVTGWNEFRTNSNYWNNHKSLYKGFVSFFWIINIMALLFVTGAYTKRSRVESMVYLKNRGDAKGIFLERSTNHGCYLMPRFYLDNWDGYHYCYDKGQAGKIEDQELKNIIVQRNVKYFLFIEDENVEQRVEEIKKKSFDLEFLKKIEPSYLDKLLYFLNPRNQNEVIFIYHIP